MVVCVHDGMSALLAFYQVGNHNGMHKQLSNNSTSCRRTYTNHINYKKSPWVLPVTSVYNHIIY